MWYVDTTPGNVLTEEAAGGVFDTMVRFLRTGIRTVGVLALVLALAAFLTGPSTAAVRTRATLERGIGSAREGAEGAGWQTGRFGAWTYAHKRALQIATAIAGGLVLMFWSQPSGWVVVGIALVVVLALAVIEFLAQPPAQPAPTAPAAPAQEGVATPETTAEIPRPRTPEETPSTAEAGSSRER
jgi:hypothetical protein